jgi:glycosyltransferase involved in cell wall biosynthesis
MKKSKPVEKKLVLGITFPGSIILLKGQASYFKSLGYKVYLLSPPEERIEKYCTEEGCIHVPVNIARTINPLNDIITLYKLIIILKKIKPDIINVGTPKMGLLGIMAAAFARIKKRIYTCRGLRYEHEKGLKRRVLILTEKTASHLAHHIVCISKSVRDRGIYDGVFSEKKATLIGHGSSNGVDLDHFSPQKINQPEVYKLKAEFGLEGKFVFGFVGRLLDRKGLKELYDAFYLVNQKHKNTYLIVLGGITKGQLTDESIIEKFYEHPAIDWLGFQPNVPLFMSAFDVLVLPAWWEGFGNVLIQAAAMGVPVVSTFGTGCRDAVKDGFNGTLVPVKDIKGLGKVMENYIEDESLRKNHGKNGIEWAKNFRSEIIWEGLHKLYSTS